MTGLLDGTTVPWHFVSGKTEPGATSQLPTPVRREVPWSPNPEQVRVFDQLAIAAGQAMASLAANLRRFK